MRPVSMVTRMWVGLLALGGLAGAHALAFLFVAPDSHAREHLFEATGHSAWYWPAAAVLAGVIAASVGVVARRLLGSRLSESRSWVGVGGTLAMLQVGGFLLLEAAERTVAGGAPQQILVEPVIVAGVVAQLLVALLITVVLSFVVEVIVRLKRGLAALFEPHPTAPSTPALVVRARRLAALRTAWGLRGPPLHSVF